MTAIILLNWNGADDTIECLRSLDAMPDRDFFVIVADNGSTNDSVALIDRYLKDEWNGASLTIAQGSEQTFPSAIAPATCILYTLNENYGFASGNNRAVALAGKCSPDYFLLLNNDTVAEPDFLTRLVNYIEENPRYIALTPLICYFDDKELIWNCGGALKWGFRKYYYARRRITDLPDSEAFDIQFITGCALFFKARLVDSAPLLTERFFHGEEDFDFSCRMKEHGKKMACVLTSRIYHKVSVSLSGMDNLGKIYIYYLNRMINMRTRMFRPEFLLWEQVNRFYVRRMLTRKGFSPKVVGNLLRRLHTDCRNHDSVTKEMFFKAMRPENSHNR